MYLTFSKNKWLLLIILTVLLAPDLAMAMSQGTPMEIQNEFKTVALNFYARINGLALKLLWGLFGVEVAWAITKHIVEQNPFEKLIGLLFKFAFAPAVYTLFVLKGAEWLPAIVQSFQFFALKGVGFDKELNPIAIFDMGVQLQNAMVTSYNHTSGADTMVGAFKNILPSLLMMAVCLVILGSFAAMALILFITTIESYLLLATAPILFALGSNRWTKDIALKPWNSMIAVGLKILILYLIMSVSLQLAPLWANMAASWSLDDWSPLWYVAFSALGTAILTWKIPKIAADALSGTASLSAGEALQIAAAAIAGAVGATAVGAKLAEKTMDATSDVLGKAGGHLATYGQGHSISSISSDNKAQVPIPDPTGPSPIGDGKPSTISNSPIGNANGASISGAGNGEGNIDKMFEKFAAQNQQQRKLSDKVQDGIRSFQSAVPNDQATVGGDLVKNHGEG
jgi:type IV secretion system protein TrbL